MPRVGLLVQGCPLGHAEAVLLVHHHQGCGGQFHPVLDKGVGAAQHQRLAGGRPGQHPALFGGGHGADQQLRGDAVGRQKLLHGGPVLPGQQLGGGHHHRLPAVAGGQPDAGRRHQRFA